MLGGVLMIPFLSLLFVLYFASKEEGAMGDIIIIGAIILVIAVILLLCFYMGIYHTMCYKLQEKELILKCSSFSSKIQYEKIKKIEKITDLGYAPVGFMRFPKYLLGGVYFSKYGWITMYATSYRNVLVIETDKKRYGITPNNEEDFLRILNERLKEGGR
jgi:hypothetical protein